MSEALDAALTARRLARNPNRCNPNTEFQLGWEAASEHHVTECTDTQGAWLEERDLLQAEVRRLGCLVASANEDLTAARDEHHTMDELYEYRMLYNAHAALGWLADCLPVVKSWRHSDGELCFGGGWFIVTATLPSGQVSNHYAAEHWEIFQVPEVRRPPVYDGHTPADAAERLRAALTPTRGEAHE